MSTLKASGFHEYKLWIWNMSGEEVVKGSSLSYFIGSPGIPSTPEPSGATWFECVRGLMVNQVAEWKRASGFAGQTDARPL